MSDQTAPVGEDTSTPETGTEDTQPKADDYQSRIDQRLDEMGQTQRQMFEQFQAWQEAQQEPEEEYDPLDGLDPESDEYDEALAQKQFQEAVDARVQEALTPIQQQQQLDRRNQAYQKLQDKYTELQDEQKAAPIVEAVAGWAIENIGEHFLNTPAFVDLIEREYKAHVADQRAAQETPASSRQEVQLESGGGAAPADREEDIQDRIIEAAKRASPLI